MACLGSYWWAEGGPCGRKVGGVAASMGWPKGSGDECVLPKGLCRVRPGRT